MTFSLRDPRQPGYCRLAEEEALHLGLITLDDLIPAHMREREHAEDEAFLAERARGWRPIDERFAQYADDDGFVSSFVIEQIEREERRACRQRAAQQRAAQQRDERKHRAKARRAAHRRAKSRRLDARQVQRTDPAVDTLAAGTDNDPAAATLPLPRPDQVEPVAPGEPGAPASPGSAGSAGSAGGADQVACLRAMIELLADVDGRDGGCTAATRIDLIAVCEQLKGSLSAAQARVSVAFADAQADAAEAAGESVRAAQRGIAP